MVEGHNVPMRSIRGSTLVKAVTAIVALTTIVYGGLWALNIDDRRTYALLDTALDYGGVDDRGVRSYRTEEPRAFGTRCVGRTSVGLMTADMNGLDGLAVAATMADRYEQQGWAVRRFIANTKNDTGEEGRRIFIATTDEMSLRGIFNDRGAQLGIRTGPCVIDYVNNDNVSLEVDTFDRDLAQQDRLFALLDTAIAYGVEADRERELLIEDGRMAATFPRTPGCDGASYQANARARMVSGGGVERAEVIAERFEQEGWEVQRLETRWLVRWFIATREDVSMLAEMRNTTVNLDVRAGPCITVHTSSELITTANPVREFTPIP